MILYFARREDKVDRLLAHAKPLRQLVLAPLCRLTPVHRQHHLLGLLKNNALIAQLVPLLKVIPHQQRLEPHFHKGPVGVLLAVLETIVISLLQNLPVRRAVRS